MIKKKNENVPQTRITLNFCGSCILFENPPIFANIHFNIVNKNRICKDNATSMLKLMYRIAFLQQTFLLKAPLNPNVKMYLHKAPINSAVYLLTKLLARHQL